MQSAAPEAAPAVQLTAADADRRKAAACTRSVLQAERTILAAASKDLKTYVVCPGILFGEALCLASMDAVLLQAVVSSHIRWQSYIRV